MTNPAQTMFTSGGFLSASRRPLSAQRCSGWGTKYNAPAAVVDASLNMRRPRSAASSRHGRPAAPPLPIGDAADSDDGGGEGLYAHSVMAYNRLVRPPRPVTSTRKRRPEIPGYTEWVAASGGATGDLKDVYRVSTQHRLKSTFKRAAFVDGATMREILMPPRQGQAERPRSAPRARASEPPLPPSPTVPPQAGEQPQPMLRAPLDLPPGEAEQLRAKIAELAAAAREAHDKAKRLPRLRVGMRWVRVPQPQDTSRELFRKRINTLQIRRANVSESYRSGSPRAP